MNDWQTIFSPSEIFQIFAHFIYSRKTNRKYLIYTEKKLNKVV